MVLIEDIDSFKASAVRDKVTSVESSLTLFGLLNAFDGILAPDGRILIITTNNPQSVIEKISVLASYLVRHL